MVVPNLFNYTGMENNLNQIMSDAKTLNSAISDIGWQMLHLRAISFVSIDQHALNTEDSDPSQAAKIKNDEEKQNRKTKK